MCNFDRIAGFIIAAEVAYLISLGMVAAAIVLGSNPFTSAGNIPLMIASAVSAGVAAGLVAAAIASLDECTNGPCGSTAATLRTNLIALAIAMGTYCVMLAALAVVAAVPFVGSAAAAALCIWAIGLSALFSAIIAGYLGNTIQAFNTCMQQQNSGNNVATAVIVGLTVVIALAAIVVAGGAGAGVGVCVGPLC